MRQNDCYAKQGRNLFEVAFKSGDLKADSAILAQRFAFNCLFYAKNCKIRALKIAFKKDKNV